MENTPPDGFLGQLKWLAERYVNDRLDLYKLQGAEKMARLTGLFVVAITMALVGFMLLFFISFMGGYYFAQYTGSLYTGFAIVAGFYALVLLWFLVYGSKKISAKVSDIVIREIFNEDEDEKKENGKQDN